MDLENATNKQFHAISLTFFQFYYIKFRYSRPLPGIVPVILGIGTRNKAIMANIKSWCLYFEYLKLTDSERRCNSGARVRDTHSDSKQILGSKPVSPPRAPFNHKAAHSWGHSRKDAFGYKKHLPIH